MYVSYQARYITTKKKEEKEREKESKKENSQIYPITDRESTIVNGRIVRNVSMLNIKRKNSTIPEIRRTYKQGSYLFGELLDDGESVLLARLSGIRRFPKKKVADVGKLHLVK